MLHKIVIGCSMLAMLFGGCGGQQGPERAVVSGNVTFQGEPVKEGRIRLIPESGSQMPVAVAEIIDGRYQVKALGGAAVGKHKIEITAHRATGQPTTDPPIPGAGRGGMQQVEQYIPEKYNAQTVLEIDIQPGSGKITKDLDLIP